jgi:hypothetical protein
MIGIPMLVLSPVVGLVNKRAAGSLFKCGWALQFVGHYLFEHNKPVFLETRNPFTFLSALLFVSALWYRVFTGQSIAPPQSHYRTAKQADFDATLSN